jgi:hypothetical protein
MFSRPILLMIPTTGNLLTVNMRQIMKTQEVIKSPIMRETFIPKGLVVQKK